MNSINASFLDNPLYSVNTIAHMLEDNSNLRN